MKCDKCGNVTYILTEEGEKALEELGEYEEICCPKCQFKFSKWNRENEPKSGDKNNGL